MDNTTRGLRMSKCLWTLQEAWELTFPPWYVLSAIHKTDISLREISASSKLQARDEVCFCPLFLSLSVLHWAFHKNCIDVFLPFHIPTQCCLKFLWDGHTHTRTHPHKNKHVMEMVCVRGGWWWWWWGVWWGGGREGSLRGAVLLTHATLFF